MHIVYLLCPTDLALLRFKIKRLMEQPQHGFSDSTPRAGGDRLQKSPKRLPSA